MEMTHDEVLGRVARCERCRDEWPVEDEFFAPDDDVCRACRYEEREGNRRRQQRWRERQRREPA
jgi:hypothetical protein